MALDNTLTPEEIKFFETGELQPGMQPAPLPDPVAAAPSEAPAAPAPAPTAAAPAAPAVAPAPSPEHNAETAEILRQSLEATTQRVAELQASIQALQAKPPAAPTEAPAPDPNTDPLGHLLHKLETMGKAVADMQTQLSNQREQDSQLSQFQAFQARVNELRNVFVKTTPDFGDAYQYLRESRATDLKSFGLTPQDIQKTLLQEEISLSQIALQQGKNPAAAVYEMAKRHGYVPKAATPAAAPVAPNDKLNAIQQAQAAAKNLPSTPQLEDITVEGLKGASDADLNKIVHDPSLWAKITGADQYPL